MCDSNNPAVGFDRVERRWIHLSEVVIAAAPDMKDQGAPTPEEDSD